MITYDPRCQPLAAYESELSIRLDYSDIPLSHAFHFSGMKLENEREQLVMLLRTLLAEAVNNREQSLVAHTREVMRCLQIFDNKG